MTTESLSLDLAGNGVPVDGVGASGRRFVVEARPGERAELAKLNDLPRIDDLKASLLVRNWSRGGVTVTGEGTARLEQICVVTLEPFTSDLLFPIDVAFLPEAELEADRAARAKRAVDPSEPPGDEDEPDPIVNGRIHLGALVAELFTLALDPYPRKPDATFEEPAPAAEEPARSPFAALKALDLRK